MLQAYSCELVLLLASIIYNEAAVDYGVAPWVKLNDGRLMPTLAFGTWLGFDEKCEESVQPVGKEVSQAVSWALDAGYRHIDTAFVYGTENQVGEAINQKIGDGSLKRRDIFVTTKLPNINHDRKAVLPTLRQSLDNLNLTCLDLYLVHFPVAVLPNGSFDQTDYVEAWKGLIDARKQGLTRSIGVSNFNLTMIERIIALTGVTPAVLQVEVNLNFQQEEVLAFCRQHKIRVMGYAPFGSLFYNRAADGAPPPRVDDPELEAIAKKYNKTVPQINLRYLVELDLTPIPKSFTKSRIEENSQIFDFRLTKSELQVLKKYDTGYRSLTLKRLAESPYYPFEKNWNVVAF